MSSLRKIDSWGNASVTYDGEKCVELVRAAHVIDLSGTDALIDAVDTSGIPSPWAQLPGHEELVVLSYAVEPTSGTSATVLIRYINRYHKKVRGGNAPEVVQKDYGFNGNQIAMTHQGNTYVGVVNAIAPRPIKTVQLYMAQMPYDRGVNIDSMQRTYQQKVVSNIFFGMPSGYWLCEAVDYETVGTVAYDVTFSFRARDLYPGGQNGWFARTIPEDEQGRPLAGAPSTYTQIYATVDLTSLGLEP